MKRMLFVFSIIFLFCIMLLLPGPVFAGASGGLLLWFNTVLPTLLPFIIISNLMIHTNAITYIARFAGPVLHRTLGVSGYGSFAVLSGFLCGYPMGAKVTADLLKTNHISLAEGRYLLSFCNNTSPMFIISYVLWQNLKDKSLLVPSVVILFLSPLLCSFFFRRFYCPKGSFHSDGFHRSGRNVTFRFEILDSCMMDSFEAIVKVGGYIMIFSILIELLKLLPVQPPLLEQLFLPMLEVTNGVPMIVKSCGIPGIRWILVLAVTSFGGLCAAAQTNCMIQGTGLSIGPYIIEKLITMVVTSLLAFIFLFL